MALHLIKLCVGIDNIEHLARVQRGRRKGAKVNYHYTRFMPKRADEILKGGSIYWVIKGYIQVRQRILGFAWTEIENEGRFCAIKLDPKLVPVEPLARRPHQGWRYFAAKDAPPDWPRGRNAKSGLPIKLIQELKTLGLI